MGNVKTIQDYNVTGGMQTQTFNYDALNRLSTATVSGGSGGQGQYSASYTYTSIGNIQSQTGVGTYSYGPKPHAVTSAGSNTYTGIV